MFEQETFEEETADVKDIMTSDEKRSVSSRERSYKSKLESIMDKFGSQDRLEIDRLDSEIKSSKNSMESIVDNLQKSINIEMSKLNLLQKAKGYDSLIQSSPEINETIRIIKTIIKGQIQQIEYLQTIIEYVDSEKTVIVEKLKTAKNSEVVMQVIAKQELMYNNIINKMQARIDKLEGIAEPMPKKEETAGKIEKTMPVTRALPKPEPAEIPDEEEKEEEVLM